MQITVYQNRNQPEKVIWGFQVTFEVLQKENRHLLPEWCSKKMVYKQINTYLKIKNTVPEKGNSTISPGIAGHREVERYLEHPVEKGDWIMDCEHKGLHIIKDKDLKQNYMIRIDN